MKRRIQNNDKTVFVPKQTVVVTFQRNILSSHKFSNSVACTVEPYIQRVIRCFRCLIYGHVTKKCRSTTTLCINCGKERRGSHANRDHQDIICIYCKNNNHKSTSKQYPVYVEQDKADRKMATENLSYVEAKQANIASNSNAVGSKNKFETLDLLSDERFPGPPQRNFPQSRRQPSNNGNHQHLNPTNKQKKKSTVSYRKPSTSPNISFLIWPQPTLIIPPKNSSAISSNYSK
ncbi:hypothetical protein JTB14_012117 [Gonioctena quinquepunctata]|nr:hypothetical protein JTB14_012117 [Gonioctena quinquepunctata]